MGWLRGGGWVCLCVLWVAASAAAQPVVIDTQATQAAPPGVSGEAAAPPAEAHACRPDCRVGFVCLDGTCVSACNPPCPDGEECTSDLRCERRAPPAWQVPTYREPPPPPPPEPDLSIRRHDGFYLSIGGGGGFTYTKLGGAGVVPAGGIDFAIGGSPSPGVAVGYAGHWLGNQTCFLNVGGLMLDVHPDPRGGLHAGFTAGWALLIDGAGEVFSGNFIPVGWGLAPEVGYDLWIGEQWSAGLTVRALMFIQEEFAAGLSVGVRVLYH